MGRLDERGYYSIDPVDLDNYITGHWGEDQFRDDVEICCFCDNEGTEDDPLVVMYDEKGLDFFDPPEYLCHKECGLQEGLIGDENGQEKA